MDKKYTLNALELNLQPTQKKMKNKDHVSLTKYSCTNEIKLSVELSLHVESLIDAKKKSMLHKGDMEVL